MEVWKELGDKYFATIKARVPAFVEKNAEVAKFLVDRTQRLAQLTIGLAQEEPGTPEHGKILELLDLVNGTIEDDVVGLTVGAAMEFKHDFELALKTLGDAIVSAIPEVVKLIKG